MIRLEGIWKRFEAKEVLRGVDLSVERGETHVIIGQSGQGKSVILKHVSGLIWPDRGTVTVDGRVISRRDRESIAFLRSQVNMLFQFGALFDSLNVRDNVGFTLAEKHRTPRDEIDARVAEGLAMVNLPGIEKLFPNDLSGGMKKRVGLARALISRPSIMLYDEPTSGLDPVTSALTDQLIIRAREKLGVTSLVVTHDMASAYRIADRISMLCQGEIIATGTPEEIRNSGDARVRQFIAGDAKGPLTTEAASAA